MENTEKETISEISEQIKYLSEIMQFSKNNLYVYSSYHHKLTDELNMDTSKKQKLDYMDLQFQEHLQNTLYHFKEYINNAN